MIFDDYFYRLTGGVGVDGKDVIRELEPHPESAFDSDGAVFGLKHVESSYDDFDYEEPKPRSYKDHEYERHANDYMIESDIIAPKTDTAVRKGEKPAILVIDDDFQTLDIMKIYLMRDYEYTSFSSAKEGIFFLKDNVVDLILFDCNIHTTPSEKVVMMIRQFKHCQNVPIIYMGDDFELSGIRNMPDGVVDKLKRPVARGDLQQILDKYIKKQI